MVSIKKEEVIRQLSDLGKCKAVISFAEVGIKRRIIFTVEVKR